jgi:hypothetical protein
MNKLLKYAFLLPLVFAGCGASEATKPAEVSTAAADEAIQDEEYAQQQAQIQAAKAEKKKK